MVKRPKFMRTRRKSGVSMETGREDQPLKGFVPHRSPMKRPQHQKNPLVHSPLGNQKVKPQQYGEYDGTAMTQGATPYYHTEYESLWREAEDRAASLSVELKFLKDKEERTLEDVETQKKLLRSAAAEVRSEMLAMRNVLDAKEKELQASARSALEAATSRDKLQADLTQSHESVKNLEAANADLSAALEENKEKLDDLLSLEKDGKNLEKSSTAMYSEQVKHLETSLQELSHKLKTISEAELEEPYPPDMKSNHIWQQAINAARARSRGQRAAAFAGQAKAEASVSALRRELDSEVRRNAALEKELQKAQVRSFSNEEKLEKKGRNLLTLSQELKDLRTTYQESELKDLASSLLSEIEPIQIDEDYLASHDLAGDGDSNDSEASSDKMQDEYKKSLSFLATAVRKSKAAMKFMKASNRAQLQAREVALNEAHEEREAYKKEKKDLTASIENLNFLNEELEAKVEELESKVASSISESDKSRVNIEGELESSKKEVEDLVRQKEELEEEMGTLRAKLTTLEEEKEKVIHDLQSKTKDLMEVRNRVSSNEDALASLETANSTLLDELEEMKQSTHSNMKKLKNQNKSLKVQNTELQDEVERIALDLEKAEARSNSLEKDFGDCFKEHGTKLTFLEGEKAKTQSLLTKANEQVRNLQRVTDDQNKSLSEIQTRLEGFVLENTKKDREIESLNSLTDTLKSQLEGKEKALEDAQVEFEDKIESIRTRRNEDTNYVESLKKEIRVMKELAESKDAEEDELHQQIVKLERSLKASKESLIQEQQNTSKQSIETEKLNVYINAIKIEMEKYIEMLTSSNSEKSLLEDKLQETESQLARHIANAEKKDRESDDQKLLYEEQLELLKENLERKNEQIKLYGKSCAEVLLQSKELIGVALGHDLSPEDSYETPSGSSFDFETNTYLQMKELETEIYPLLMDRISENREKMLKMEKGIRSLENDLESALAREGTLRMEFTNLQNETYRCKEERDNSVDSSEILQAQIVELKRILEASAMKLTETEIAMQCKSSELSHLQEELETVRNQQKDLNAVIDLFRELGVHFADFLFAMEQQLKQVSLIAENSLASIAGNESAFESTRKAMLPVLEEIRSLEQACKEQRDAMSASAGRSSQFTSTDEKSKVYAEEILILKEGLVSSSKAIDKENKLLVKPANSLGGKRNLQVVKHTRRPWWQNAIVLPIRLLPAAALIVSSSKSKEVRQRASEFFSKASSSSKRSSQKLIGSKPYASGSFAVPKNGTRELISVTRG